jgi:small subunit ribosomal protein S6
MSDLFALRLAIVGFSGYLTPFDFLKSPENKDMSNRYEGLFILNVKGSDDSAGVVIERLTKDLAAEGASIEQVQRMDRRKFTYAAGDLGSGYYVNFVFTMEPAALLRIKSKLTLDEDVYRSFFVRLPLKKAKAA